MGLLADAPDSMRFSAFIAHLSASLACTAIVLLAGCGDTPRLPRLANDAVVLAFGDSLIFGTGAAEHESFPARLAQRIGRQVVRSGVPGEVSAAGLLRLPGELDEHRPALLILCHGGNDFLRRLDRRGTEANLRAMVALAKARGIAVLLVGTPEPGITLATPAFYGDIAGQLKVPYEDGVIGKVLRDSALKADPVHPNAKGYALIAERLEALLRTSGAL